MPSGPAPVVGDSGPLEVGPGWLFAAALGTAEPPDMPGIPSSALFALDIAWKVVGYTDTGIMTEQALTVNDIEVEEEFEPVDVRTTKRVTTVTLAAAQMTVSNLKRAFNGGTVSAPLTSGAVKYDPPAVGQENKIMLLHVSEDGALMILWRRCLQTGNVQQQMKKAPQKRLLPMTFRAMKPSGVQPWTIYADAAHAA